MDEPIDARYLWDVEAMTDAMAAGRRALLRPIFRVLLHLLCFIAMVGSVAIPASILVQPMALPETRRNAAIVLPLIVVTWAWLIDSARKNRFLRMTARKVFRSIPGGSVLVEWSFGLDEIVNRTSNSASTLLWPVFIKVAETPKGFLLYQTSQFFNWVPGHAFASRGELRRFTDLARAKVPNYVVLDPCQFPAKPEPIGLDEL